MAATTQGTALTDDGSGDVAFGQKQIDAYAYSPGDLFPCDAEEAARLIAAGFALPVEAAA